MTLIAGLGLAGSKGANRSVQIGDIHIGKAESAVLPALSIIEAAMIWDLLVARYKCIEETGLYHACAHDPDLRAVIRVGLNFLEEQAVVLEEQAKKFELPMPNRPPKEFSQPGDSTFINDRFIFKQIFEGCQGFIDQLARVSRSMVTNDPLRHIMNGFLKDELSLFDKMCWFGKTKGWMEVPPVYRAD